MKRLEKYISFLLVLALSAGICLLFCTRKKGLFIDEVYSYGLANSYYAPFLADLKDGSMTGKIFTAEELDAYLTVGEDDAFAFGSVYYNQTRDVHPPLYYFLFHAVSSVFRGSASKWIGLGINFFFFLFTALLLWRLSLALFETPAAATAAVLLYTVSIAGISTVMIIRMYMMLTFFSVALACAVLQMIRRGPSPARFAIITLVIFLGALTQYYFVFYACFLCCAVLVSLLRKKDFKNAGLFSLCALAGVGAMIAVFPACLKHLFVGNGQVVGGASITSALKDVASWLPEVQDFLLITDMTKAICAVFCLALFADVLLLLIGKALHRPATPLRTGAGIIILPAFSAFFVVAVISPVQELRYVYNLVPFFALAAAWLLDRAFRLAEGVFCPAAGTAAAADKRGSAAAALRLCMLALIAAGCVLSVKASPPADLFTAQEEYDALVKAHSSSPCIYVTDNYFAPLTQDLLQLRQFQDFLVVSDVSSDEVRAYIGDAPEAVLYIDVNGFWSSGFDPDGTRARFGAATGLTASELLYEYDYEYNGGLSQTYLMCRP